MALGFIYSRHFVGSAAGQLKHSALSNLLNLISLNPAVVLLSSLYILNEDTRSPIIHTKSDIWEKCENWHILFYLFGFH